MGCFQWFKDTKMKANHNFRTMGCEQFEGCFQWFKDTKMKANHNTVYPWQIYTRAVSNGSKILK